MNKSKRQQRLENKVQEKKRNQIKWTGIITITALVLAALLIFASQVRNPNVDHVYTEKSGTMLGNLDAPVLVIEYGDFQCSHCRNFYASSESLLINTYVETGQVLYEYRPIDFGGPESTLAAEASYCAANQNLFWEYHDILFNNYSTGNTGGYSEERLEEFASTIDMDVGAFTACLSSGEATAVLEGIRSEAFSNEVTATPSFLINGKLRIGNLPWTELVNEIETAFGN